MNYYTIEDSPKNHLAEKWMYYNDEFCLSIAKDNFVLKQCGVYAALVPSNSHLNDQYEYCFTCSHVDIYKEGKYIYSLRYNDYRPSKDMLVEFVKLDGNIIRLIINLRHNEINVCDPDTGRCLHTDNTQDQFISSFKRFKERYLFVDAWEWGPEHYKALYDLYDLCRTPKYKPVYLEIGETDEFSVVDDKLRIKMLNKDFTVEEYLASRNDIREAYSAKYYNESDKESCQS